MLIFQHLANCYESWFLRALCSLKDAADKREVSLCLTKRSVCRIFMKKALGISPSKQRVKKSNTNRTE